MKAQRRSTIKKVAQ